MSKNTAVKVRGEAQTQNGAAKYSTNLIGEGSCTWVPEDEADSYAQTTTLSASENGTYGPEEGYAGFDRVTVNVDKKLTTGNATENGTYNASENEMNGYSEFTVNVPSNLGPLYVSENGTYTPQEATYNYGGENAGDGDPEGYDGYDSVHVNILKLVEPDPVTGEPEIVIEVDPENGTGTIESCGDIAEIDPVEGLDLYIPDIDGGITPIGGVDFDPDGGIDLSSLVTDDGYVTTVDSEGNVSKKGYPVSMSITTPPTKTQYTEGETIDYHGIVCTLYDKSGGVFTDDRYPSGTISYSDAELYFPVLQAPAPSGDEGYIGNTVVDGETVYGPIHSVELTNGTTVAVSSAGEMKIRQIPSGSHIYAASGYINGVLTVVYASKDQGAYGYYIPGGESGAIAGSSVTYDGKKAYLMGPPGGTAVQFGSFPNQTASAYKVAWAMIYGDEVPAGAVDIPVLWPNDYSGAEIRQHFGVSLKFRDTFEIEVTG